jgi:hypothetical protein
MPDPTCPDCGLIAVLLRRWLGRRVAGEGLAWLDAAAARLAAARGAEAERALFLGFAAAPRRIGKAELAPGPEELAEAAAARPGWQPRGWSCDQAARALLLLSHRQAGPVAFGRALDRLAAAAELRELVCLYQALPLLPWPERHRARAAEGLRSSITPVFEAVALHNPYPAEALEEGAWNQLVLKAVFLGSPLPAIAGLDRRANPALAAMLVDYARERRAAGRPVPHELWRLVGPFADARAVAALRHALADPDPRQQRAAALALAAAPGEEARAVLAGRPDLAAEVAAGRPGREDPAGPEG